MGIFSSFRPSGPKLAPGYVQDFLKILRSDQPKKVLSALFRPFLCVFSLFSTEGRINWQGIYQHFSARRSDKEPFSILSSTNVRPMSVKSRLRLVERPIDPAKLVLEQLCCERPINLWGQVRDKDCPGSALSARSSDMTLAVNQLFYLVQQLRCWPIN